MRIVLVRHCGTAPVCSCGIVSMWSGRLCHCANEVQLIARIAAIVSLCHCVSAPLRHCAIMSLCQCCPIGFHFSNCASYCAIAPLCQCAIVAMRSAVCVHCSHCVIVSLCSCVIVSVRHCAIARLWAMWSDWLWELQPLCHCAYVFQLIVRIVVVSVRHCANVVQLIVRIVAVVSMCNCASASVRHCGTTPVRHCTITRLYQCGPTGCAHCSHCAAVIVPSHYCAHYTTQWCNSAYCLMSQ